MRKLCIFHRGLFVDLLVSRRACRAAQKSWLFAIARARAQKTVYAKEKFKWRLLRVLYVLRVHILARLHTFMYKLLAGLLSRALLQPQAALKWRIACAVAAGCVRSACVCWRLKDETTTIRNMHLMIMMMKNASGKSRRSVWVSLAIASCN